jgi:hypothetical protein
MVIEETAGNTRLRSIIEDNHVLFHLARHFKSQGCTSALPFDIQCWSSLFMLLHLPKALRSVEGRWLCGFTCISGQMMFFRS